MSENPLKILLIEGMKPHSNMILGLLKLWGSDFSVHHVATLEEGLKELNTETSSYNAVLTNIILADTAGYDVVQRLVCQQNPVPIIAIVADEDLDMGKEMLSYGAQDYLNIKTLSPELLRRSIFYSAEREQLVRHIRDISLTDELTELYNRRGFRTFAEQQVKIVKRTKQKCTLVFLDLDNLKVINDTLGHREGDYALIATAKILKTVLRTSDIISRLGGDEFVMLAPDTNNKGAENLVKRIQTQIDKYNKESNSKYQLSASIGTVIYNGEPDTTLSDLQAAACKEMYLEKKAKKKRNVL